MNIRGKQMANMIKKRSESTTETVTSETNDDQSDVTLRRLKHSPQVPKGIKVHNVIETWTEAYYQCQKEGTILASPINDRLLNVMKSVISITNATYYIGTKAYDHPGYFVSIEGVAFENMSVSLRQQLDAWKGDCLAMTFKIIIVVPCQTRLPYICYNPHAYSVNNTECGLGYKYDVSTKQCYCIYEEISTWDEAHWGCASEGAHLAVIENEIQAQTIRNMYGFIKSNLLFIGLRYHKGKGDWRSVNGDAVQTLYNVWEYGPTPVNINLQCGAIYTTGKLDDQGCSTKLPFVCQKEPLN